MTLSLGKLELGDEPAQIHRLADTFEAHLRRAQEETTKANPRFGTSIGSTCRTTLSYQIGKEFSLSEVR
jgi:hypothetical protein